LLITLKRFFWKLWYANWCWYHSDKREKVKREQCHVFYRLRSW